MKFKKKLDEVKKLGLLSDDKLWTNLKLLNDVRNKYAHQWEYNFLADYRSKQNTTRFYDKTGQDIREKLLKGGADDMQILLGIKRVTATWLSEHCFAVHKIIGN